MSGDLTEAEADELRERLKVAMRGPVVSLSSLSWRTRLGLRLAARVNRLGCWLVEHEHIGTATLLWRVCRSRRRGWW